MEAGRTSKLSPSCVGRRLDPVGTIDRPAPKKERAAKKALEGARKMGLAIVVPNDTGDKTARKRLLGHGPFCMTAHNNTRNKVHKREGAHEHEH